MDRLKALEIFKTVADKGSFVRTADSLNLSTAVVTRAVKDLESLLGIRLLQRTTRRVSLTSEGQGVLERARSLLDSFDELAAASGLGASEPAGEIRFTAPASFSSRLGPVLADFSVRYPRVRLQLLATDTPLDLVEERVDLALRITRRLPDALVARRIGDVPVGIYAAPGYLSARGTPKHPDELRHHDCLVHSSTGRDTTWPFLHPVSQQLIEAPARGSLLANNAEALMSAAVRGSGLALLPQFLAQGSVARGQLQMVLNHWPSPPLGMYLAYTSRRNQPVRVRQLIDHLLRTMPAVAGIRPAGDDDLEARRMMQPLHDAAAA